MFSNWLKRLLQSRFFNLSFLPVGFFAGQLLTYCHLTQHAIMIKAHSRLKVEASRGGQSTIRGDSHHSRAKFRSPDSHFRFRLFLCVPSTLREGLNGAAHLKMGVYSRNDWPRESTRMKTMKGCAIDFFIIRAPDVLYQIRMLVGLWGGAGCRNDEGIFLRREHPGGSCLSGPERFLRNHHNSGADKRRPPRKAATKNSR